MVASDYLVDTSNIYTGGESERILGRALARTRRVDRVLSKADRDSVTNVFDGDRVRRSLDESLERLGVDHLPLYQLHDPYGVSFEDAMAPSGAVAALVALRDSGVIDAIGIAAGRTALVHRYVQTGVFDVVLSHNRFTLVDRAAARIFESARDRGMTVLNAAPFGGGILADSGGTKRHYGYRQAPSSAFHAHIEKIRSLAREWGVELAAAAVQFSLRSELVDSTVVGVSSLERLAQLHELIGASVPAEFFDAVDELGAPPASPND
jgi:D-threo-aldose 1-dehydrogenase